MQAAVARGDIPALEHLAAADRHWGHAIFDFVATEYGAQGIRRYLATLRDGQTSQIAAIRTAFGVPANEFNLAFRKYVRMRFSDVSKERA